MISCVYVIKNILNNKVYIGSTENFQHRVKTHIWRLNRNNHHSIHLQSSWLKYGKESFMFDIVEECDIKDLRMREHVWIEIFDSINPNFGYNLDIITENGSSNRKQETKDKISLSLKSYFSKNKKKGAIWSNEAKKHMSEIKKGHIKTKEEKLKRIKTMRERYPNWHSEETKRKISEAKKGKKYKPRIK